PTAAINANPISGDAPLLVNFDGSASSDPDGTISSYAWTFEPGSTGTGANSSHTYTTPGPYTAQLIVTDNDGLKDTATVNITVTQPAQLQAPMAVFGATPTSGDAPLLVNFDATASSDPDGNISSFEWLFEAGSSATGNMAIHTYNSPGVYMPRLIVTDNDGLKDTTTVTVTVNESSGDPLLPPLASFTASTTSGTAPLNVSFDATASSDPDGSIVSYDWLFATGNTGSGPTPSTSFVQPGTYTPRLIVTDNDGLKDTATITITVNQSGGGNPGPCTLSAPWSSTDVGNVGVPGESCEGTTAGSFTITASGTQIAKKWDLFHYMYQPLSGDGWISARITSLGATTSNSVAGVMIRKSTGGNARNVFMGINAQEQWVYQTRKLKTAQTNQQKGPANGT
ncbi:MAG: PKD domain-containing protein, partial [Bacteroidota bacterium]